MYHVEMQWASSKTNRQTCFSFSSMTSFHFLEVTASGVAKTMEVSDGNSAICLYN